MQYNEFLANRIRERLMHLPDAEEKVMFNGLVFMVNGKMCIGVRADEVMLRIGTEAIEMIDHKDGWRQMIHGNRLVKGYVFVSEDVLNQNEELDFWVNLALRFNPSAKKSKK